MSDKKISVSFWPGLPAAVFIVFLTLKLAEIGQVASWSWWWVASPLWIPVTVILTVLLVVGAIWCLIALLAAIVGVFK